MRLSKTPPRSRRLQQASKPPPIAPKAAADSKESETKKSDAKSGGGKGAAGAYETSLVPYFEHQDAVQFEGAIGGGGALTKKSFEFNAKYSGDKKISSKNSYVDLLLKAEVNGSAKIDWLEPGEQEGPAIEFGGDTKGKKTAAKKNPPYKLWENQINGDIEKEIAKPEGWDVTSVEASLEEGAEQEKGKGPALSVGVGVTVNFANGASVEGKLTVIKAQKGAKFFELKGPALEGTYKIPPIDLARKSFVKFGDFQTHLSGKIGGSVGIEASPNEEKLTAEVMKQCGKQILKRFSTTAAEMIETAMASGGFMAAIFAAGGVVTLACAYAAISELKDIEALPVARDKAYLAWRKGVMGGYDCDGYVTSGDNYEYFFEGVSSGKARLHSAAVKTNEAFPEFTINEIRGALVDAINKRAASVFNQATHNSAAWVKITHDVFDAWYTKNKSDSMFDTTDNNAKHAWQRLRDNGEDSEQMKREVDVDTDPPKGKPW